MASSLAYGKDRSKQKTMNLIINAKERLRRSTERPGIPNPRETRVPLWVNVSMLFLALAVVAVYRHLSETPEGVRRDLDWVRATALRNHLRGYYLLTDRESANTEEDNGTR
jgi:hypothetical protein